MSEHKEQVAVIQYLTFLQPRYGFRFYAIPNGGARNAITGAILKAEGVSKGIPDICIPFKTKYFSGLYIEMKNTIGGYVSKEQREWLNYLTTQNFKAVICNGSREAITQINYFLGEENPF